jgi:hypothetical protein
MPKKTRRAAANGETVADKRAAVNLPPSIANLEVISQARSKGLAQVMADWGPCRLSRLRDWFFAALRDRRIVEQIADLAQAPQQRREEFITKVRNLIWVATVRDSVRSRAGAALDIDNMKKALVELFRARDALHRLSGLIDSAPIDAMIGDLVDREESFAAPC